MHTGLAALAVEVGEPLEQAVEVQVVEEVVAHLPLEQSRRGRPWPNDEAVVVTVGADDGTAMVATGDSTGHVPPDAPVHERPGCAGG